VSADAGEIKCGDVVLVDHDPAVNAEMVAESYVLEKCGEPMFKAAGKWLYERPEGVTKVLHFNDDGKMVTIKELWKNNEGGM